MSNAILRLAAAILAMTTVLVAQSASGRLLVLNKDDATFVIVNPDSGAVLGKVPVGQGPHELVASTDGKYAFASNYGTGPAPGHTISMIDIAALKELRRIDVAPLSRPHGLAFLNGKLYFSAEADKKIARYDPATDKIDWQFETGQNATHMVLPTKDAKMFFTSNIASDSVSAIQQVADGSWTQIVIPVGKGPEGLDLSPNGRELWSAHSRDGGVSIIDVATKKVTATIPLGTRRSNRIKLTPDGYFELLSDGTTRAMFLEVDLGTEALSVWEQKTAIYLQLALSGEFQKRFRQPQFRVLVVTDSERRLANIRSAVAKSTDKIFWFATFENINRDGLWSPVWLRPTGNQRHSLI